jgi:hypothetical protein
MPGTAAIADLRRKPRPLVHDSILSNNGVSGNPGAVHSLKRTSPRVTTVRYGNKLMSPTGKSHMTENVGGAIALLDPPRAAV